MRLIPLFLLVACGPGTVQFPDGDEVSASGWVDEPWAQDPAEEEAPDTSQYDGATLHIVSPTSGEFMTYGQVASFEAELVAADGTFLESTDVEWSSDRQESWFHQGLAFEADDLEVGIHALTAQATLPNGDHLAHTVGGLLVQAKAGGTYAGILRVNGTIQNIPVACVGSSVIWVDEYGIRGEGNGECLISIVISIPLNYVFDLDITELGVISGDAGVDLVGWFTYNFPAIGQLDPDNYGIDMTFNGDVPLLGTLNGSVEAPRVSMDSQPL